jgi:hypothetical protein
VLGSTPANIIVAGHIETLCCSRLLTVVNFLRQKGRDICPFLEQAWIVLYRGREIPSSPPDTRGLTAHELEQQKNG